VNQLIRGGKHFIWLTEDHLRPDEAAHIKRVWNDIFGDEDIRLAILPHTEYINSSLSDEEEVRAQEES
jgi:hypothetical protein